jgi:hypothetical protein
VGDVPFINSSINHLHFKKAGGLVFIKQSLALKSGALFFVVGFGKFLNELEK